MTDKNKVKLIIGLVFIVVSFLCTMGILYVIGQRQNPGRSSSFPLEVELANLIAEKSEPVIRQTSPHWTRRDPIDAGKDLASSKDVYGKGELERKEGVLWIDRKTSRLFVTLGKVNGLQRGSRLSVDEGPEKIGRVIVETPLDIVSIVRLAGKTLDDFSKNYYKVSVESH